MSFAMGTKSGVLLRTLLNRSPDAKAKIRGEQAIRGEAAFYQLPCGVLMRVEVNGLPEGEGVCGGRIFGFHIHEGGRCAGNQEDPYADAGSHYNPGNCPHPEHAGDLPPLFGNHGFAFMTFLTDRFRVEEILGKTVIIHDSPDDFTSQPAGNSGKKIACGMIRSH